MRLPKRMRVSAVLSDLEDPKVFKFLEDLTGEGRAMRLRLLIRVGIDVLQPPDRPTSGTIIESEAPAPDSALPSPARPSLTLAALGVTGFKKFPSTITKSAHRHDNT